MQPHGVSMVTRNPPPGWDRPFDFAAPHYGETCFAFINRLANQRGLLLTDDKDGNLVAGQADASTAAVSLVEGRNILRAVGVLDDENAWSTTGMIQQFPGTDQTWGTTRAAAATVQNPGLTRANRVRLVHGDMAGDPSQLATRTSFENMLTASTIVQASVTVVGWFKPSGDLWKEGDSVTVLSPMLFPMTTGAVKLSVQSVTYAQDPGEGTTTTLELVQSAAARLDHRPKLFAGPARAGPSRRGAGGSRHAREGLRRAPCPSIPTTPASAPASPCPAATSSAPTTPS